VTLRPSVGAENPTAPFTSARAVPIGKAMIGQLDLTLRLTRPWA